MLLILFAAVFAVRDPIEELYQRVGESVRETARRRLFLDACNVETETDCTAAECTWYNGKGYPNGKCLTKWGVHECSAQSPYSYTCLADTDGKYLQQKIWTPNDNGEVDCNATPSQKVNLYHGMCTDIFGTDDLGNGKFICDQDGNIYIDSCAGGEQVADVWGLMSSIEQPFDSSCTNEGGEYSKISCDSDSRYVTTQYDDSTCTSFNMKMAFTKTCKNWALETGDNGEMTTYPISVACSDSAMLMTQCSTDSKLITDMDNMFLTMDYIEVKLKTECDCDEDGCQKYTCAAETLTVKGYSDNNCQTETKSAVMPLNKMTKQSFPPAEFVDPDDGVEEFFFKSTCANGVYKMDVGSVFSSLKKSDAEKYVSPSEVTMDGDTMKYDGQTVTATMNKDIATIPKNSDDPSYKKAKASGDSSSAELMVLFGFLASIFAL